MVILVYFHILQLPQTVISNSEKLTHPIVAVVVIVAVIGDWVTMGMVVVVVRLSLWL